MTKPASRLDELQQWLLTTITHPAGVEIGAPAHQINETILPSRQQSASERLAVYGNAYFARLLEVLRGLFPCTRFAVGDELFDQFAAGYLQAHPPHSYTLARLNDKLVDYLDQTRPADWGGFVVEIAMLEQAIDRVFDGPGPERLPPFALPLDAGPSIRIATVPGFELHAFVYPVSTYYSQWKAKQQPQWPERHEQFIALLRRDYIVRRYELTATQYDVLLALQRGCSIGEALATVAERMEQADVDKLAVDVRCWFESWSAERFFVGIAD